MKHVHTAVADHIHAKKSIVLSGPIIYNPLLVRTCAFAITTGRIMHRDVFRVFAFALFFVYHFAWIFFLIVAGAELLGKNAVDPGVLFCILVPVVLVLLYLSFLVASQLSISSSGHTDSGRQQQHQQHRAHNPVVRYPRYMWDVWTFHLVTLCLLVFVIAGGISYCVQYGFDARPTLDVIDAQVAHFIYMHVLLVSGGLISVAVGMPMFYAYTLNSYELVSVQDIGLWIQMPAQANLHLR